MGNQRTVAFINHTAILGGGEYALIRLISALDRKAWCPVAVFGEDGPAVDLLRKKSVETYVIPMGSHLKSTRRQDWSGVSSLKLSRLWEAGRFVLNLKQFLRDRSPDLVHTNSLKSHLLGGIASTWSGVPVVWHMRDLIEVAHLPLSAVRHIRFFAARLPEMVVCVSKCVESVIQGEGEGANTQRTCVVYDGLEEEAFCKNESEKRDGNKWRVGIAGRLTPWKGQHLVLEAASILMAKGYEIEWEVVGGALFGEKNYEEGLKNQSLELGLQKIVRFRGQVSDVTQRIRTWDISIHASTAPDPCPNVVLESMAAGVAVVGANSGGVPELLESGLSGELFRMGQADQLAIAIERLLMDRDLRHKVAQRAKLRAETLFRSERVAREIEGVWTKVLEGRDRPSRHRAWIEGEAASPAFSS